MLLMVRLMGCSGATLIIMDIVCASLLAYRAHPPVF